MIGRQVIKINRSLTLTELEKFMQDNWDKEKYGDFTLGAPTGLSIEDYILLPATQRFLIIVYTRSAKGLFSKDNKVILSTADTPAGAQQSFFEYVPTESPIFKIWQTSSVLDSEKERRGPAEEALQLYTSHMKEILSREGLMAE